MAVNDWPEGKWTLSLRRQPASDADGRPRDDGTGEYELVCRDCGDDPRFGYCEVPAEFQQVRGPYRLKAGIEAFVEHEHSPEPAF